MSAHDSRQLLRQSDRQIRELRAQGMSLMKIAAKVGVSYQAVRKAVDPDEHSERMRFDNAKARARKRAWENENYERIRKDRCDCGDDKQKTADRCQGCISATADVRRTLVEGMWADGWQYAEIHDAVGVGLTALGRLREHGYDLPYRYRGTKRQVANVA